MAPVPKEIFDKLATTNFLSEFEAYRRQNRVKVAVSDPNFISFLSRYLGLPESEVNKYARQLVILVGDILSGRVKLKSDDPAQAQGEPHIHVNTLANTLYLIFYKLSPATASKMMYELLEPYMVKALSGDPESLRIVDVFFSPITSSNIKEVAWQLREVLFKHRELCRLKDDFNILCLKSSFLPVSKSTGSVSPVDGCLEITNDIVSEVCGNE